MNETMHIIINDTIKALFTNKHLCPSPTMCPSPYNKACTYTYIKRKRERRESEIETIAKIETEVKNTEI